MVQSRHGTTIRRLVSGRFQVRYRLHGEQITGGTYDTRSEAERRAQEIEVDLERGTHWDGRKGRIKFADFMRTFMEVREHKVAPGTFRNDRSYLNRHLLPTFGRMPMQEIDPEVVDRWWFGHPETVTRRNAYMLMAKAMKYAVRNKYIQQTPCMVEEAGKDVSKPRPTWTYQDFRAVLTHVPQRFQSPLEVMFAGHLRLGELIALDASDYDRRRGAVTISKQLTDMGIVKETKTGQIKTIRLLRNGIDAMENHLPQIGAGPLFRGERAERLPRNTLRKAWNQAVEAAGFENFHLHDLRHISLSLVAQGGAPVKDIQNRGGHASITSAFRYQHTDEERDIAVALATDELLAN